MRTVIQRTALVAAALAAFCHFGPSHAEPNDYVLDDDHTHIVWQVNRFGFTNTIGTFTEVTGKLAFDEDAPNEGSVVAEISLAGLRSDLAEREEIVRGSFWLDAEAYPSIKFESSSVKFIDDEACSTQCGVVEGDMILRGVKAPLNLDVRINKIGVDPVLGRRAIGFTATGSFLRSAYGVKTAIGLIGDEVTFQIEALAIAARDTNADGL
ncbi:MAG: YceI family protein [Pseudomonadota bacterium]